MCALEGFGLFKSFLHNLIVIELKCWANCTVLVLLKEAEVGVFSVMVCVCGQSCRRKTITSD